MQRMGKIMTKKNFIAKMENAKGVTFDENTKVWKMSKSKFDDFMNRDEFTNVKIIKSKKNENLFRLMVDNTEIGIVETKTTKPRNNAKGENVSRETSKTENVTGGKGFKPRNAKYIVKYKNIGEKSEKTNNDFSTRNDLVAWLKTQSRKNLEYLRIYDEMGNVCRKSAWYEKNVVNG